MEQLCQLENGIALESDTPRAAWKTDREKSGGGYEIPVEGEATLSAES